MKNKIFYQDKTGKFEISKSDLKYLDGIDFFYADGGKLHSGNALKIERVPDKPQGIIFMLKDGKRIPVRVIINGVV